MGAGRKVLVTFPAEVLADLDAEAKRRGVARLAVIIERCSRGDGGAVVPAEPTPKRGPTTIAKPAARAILAKAEANASHLGIGARAMESAGVPFGNIRGPMQKGGASRAGQAGGARPRPGAPGSPA